MAKKGKKQAGSKPEKTSSNDASTEGKAAKRGSLRGLQNLGNTCFLNSMLQCLNRSSPFSDELIDLSKEGVEGLAASLADVLQELRGQGKVVSPKKLVNQIISKCPWYKRGQQQDAHELLRTLLDLVSDERTIAERSAAKDKEGHKTQATSPEEPSGMCQKIIWGNFRGKLVSSVLCWKCQKVTVKLDPFLDLSLEVPDAGRRVGCMGVVAEEGASTTNAESSRKIEKSKEPSEAEDESSEDEGCPQEIDMLLKRKSQDEPWGIEWSKEASSGGRAVVKSIVADSFLDRWNLKNRSAGKSHNLIHLGDRISRVRIPAGGHVIEDVDGIVATFCKEVKLGVHVLRSSASKKALQDTATDQEEAEGDDEDKEPADIEAEAALAFASLPSDLRKVFRVESGTTVSGQHQLSDCLRQFTAVEALHDNLRPIYQCDFCEKHSTSTKPRSFATRRVWLSPCLPSLLTFQLKRFRLRGSKLEKRKDSVELPNTLDLSEFIMDREQFQQLRPHFSTDTCTKLPSAGEQPMRYELYAVCVHIGKTLTSGHYIAYVNAGPSLAKESWHYISDAEVRKCSRQDALDAESYVAFYRQEGLHATATCEGDDESDVAADESD